MFWATIYFLTRLNQLLTLIPTIGMLAWFVGQYRTNGMLTPDSILILFVVSVLAAAWAVATVIKYSFTKQAGKFMAFIEFLFSMTLIAAVYQLRFVTKTSCKSGSGSWTDGRLNIEFSKTCAMLKASFAFGIMNIVYFFTNSIVIFMLGKKHSGDSGRRKSHRRSRSRSRRHHQDSYGHRPSRSQSRTRTHV